MGNVTRIDMSMVRLRKAEAVKEQLVALKRALTAFDAQVDIAQADDVEKELYALSARWREYRDAAMSDTYTPALAVTKVVDSTFPRMGK